MYVGLNVKTHSDYFSETNQEIDWDNDDSTKIPIEQAYRINEILATEVSIYLLCRNEGFSDSLIDSMADIRKNLIKQYEEKYGGYKNYNKDYFY